MRRRSRNKFGAIKTTVDGIEFPSKLQATMYLELKALQKAKLISDLEVETPKKKIRFPIIVGNVKICEYWADATYTRDGEKVVIDAKGVRTSVFNIKWKLLKALYPCYTFELYYGKRSTSSRRRRSSKR